MWFLKKVKKNLHRLKGQNISLIYSRYLRMAWMWYGCEHRKFSVGMKDMVYLLYDIIPWVLMHSAIHIHTLHYLPWEALNSNWFVAYTDKTQLVCPSAEWVQTRSLFLPENFSFFTCPLLYGWENLNYENNWDTVQPIYRGYAHRTVTLSNNWFTI